MGIILCSDYMRADGFERERINTSCRKGTTVSKHSDLGTKDAAEDSTGTRKDVWLPGLPEKTIGRYIVLLPMFQIAFSGGMHQQ